MGSEAQDAAPDLVVLCGKEELAAAAERALEAIGLAAVSALREGLAHKAPSVRRSCARVLGRLKADDALPELRRLAAEDPDVWVRYEADLAAARS
jgi:HEAT repeat protein